MIDPLISSSSSLLLAYFDPGSGSLVLQAIVGGTAGLLVFAKCLWDAVPAFLNRKRSGDSGQA
jgi:hypothetical protein